MSDTEQPKATAWTYFVNAIWVLGLIFVATIVTAISFLIFVKGVG